MLVNAITPHDPSRVVVQLHTLCLPSILLQIVELTWYSVSKKLLASQEVNKCLPIARKGMHNVLEISWCLDQLLPTHWASYFVFVGFTRIKPLKNAEFSECVSTGQDYCNFLLFCRQNMRGRIVFLANVTTLGCIVGKLAWQTPRKTVFEFLDLSWGGNVGSICGR